ncbi:elongator complex protein 1 isoform X2 [Copidosoma floridanum]|uniref:elongator complex protein 1 isoform X2 n=1 Tax=Copidosoma floridanum TaxID=29053 RepID=UPI0006C962DB|nr:elongator complex protein 1 isoform X2 [Copidosoma floridanum]
MTQLLHLLKILTYSLSLRSEEFGQQQFITVGWGKKETQFHGSEGKAAAKAKSTVSGKTKLDDGKARVTWKGDGSMFAVSYIDQESNARRLKIFNREGVLQFTSELIDCLEGILSWKPSGNLIASTRRLPNKHTVAFFEKNGLLHREFTLPFDKKNIQIIDLIWSRDSDILGVWCKDLGSGVMMIQLWAEKNYHWYLKQTITYPKTIKVHHVIWGRQTQKDLMILTSKSSTTYTFYWSTSHSRGKSLTDKAVVGVIDGNAVLVTCFRDCVVPPPMAQQTLEFKEPVNAISFAPNNEERFKTDTNDFMVVLNKNKLIHCQYLNESWENQYIQKKAYNINFQLEDTNCYSFHLLQHLLWYKPNILLCSISLGMKSYLCEICLMDIEGLDTILLDAKTVQEMPGHIQHMVLNSNATTAYIVVSGQLYTYDDICGVQKSNLQLTSETTDKQMLKIEFMKFADEEVLVALTRKHILFVNGKQVANNVTSFFVHSQFLLITTLQHALVSFKLDDRGLKQLNNGALLNVQPWENKNVQKNQEINVRRVERGSLLVTSVSGNSRTLLQMPRGNLETIEPRALSLAIIISHLNSLNFYQAFDLMRRQRIDLNLIYDFCPESFDKNIEKFVDDLDNSSWLSLFLTELRDEDVTRTMFLGSFPDRDVKDVVGKTEKVCNSLRTVLEKKSNKFIQPILISLVKGQKKIGIEAALAKIKELTVLMETDENDKSADEAFKYLLYMVDVNVLYDMALGMYDFDLVMFIAERSQKDPKEYLPFLNNLLELDEHSMKYEINNYLKRYGSALEHIVQIPERFDECMKFIETHSLHAKGLKFFDIKSNEYKKLALSYGELLVNMSKYKEAGIMFVKAANYEEALNAFKQAGSWQDVIFSAMKLNLSGGQLTELYSELVTQLQEEKRYREAALILSKYLDRSEDSVATLCEGRYWHQAWTDAYSMKREDLIETHVKPGILDHGEFLLSQLKEHHEQYKKYKNRLAVVREAALNRQQQQLELGIEEESGRGEYSDLVSEATSVAGSIVSGSSRISSRSGRSYRSSKNRRKHERKLQSVKEGSVYEDLALIRALHSLVIQAYDTKNKIKSISEMLLFINSDHLAEELYKAMKNFLKDIRESKREIWPPVTEKKDPDSELNIQMNSHSYTDMTSTTNLIEPHLLLAPEDKPCDWELDIFSFS